MYATAASIIYSFHTCTFHSFYVFNWSSENNVMPPPPPEKSIRPPPLIQNVIHWLEFEWIQQNIGSRKLNKSHDYTYTGSHTHTNTSRTPTRHMNARTNTALATIYLTQIFALLAVSLTFHLAVLSCHHVTVLRIFHFRFGRKRRQDAVAVTARNISGFYDIYLFYNPLVKKLLSSSRSD